MADMTFEVNILPQSSSVTLGDSTHKWHAPTPEVNVKIMKLLQLNLYRLLFLQNKIL